MIIEVFIKRKILSVETVLSAHIHTHIHIHTHTHTHTNTPTHRHPYAWVYWLYETCYTQLKQTANRDLRWSTEQKTWQWQVYCFGKRNVLRYDWRESSHSFCWRGSGRSSALLDVLYLERGGGISVYLCCCVHSLCLYMRGWFMLVWTCRMTGFLCQAGLWNRLASNQQWVLHCFAACFPPPHSVAVPVQPLFCCRHWHAWGRADGRSQSSAGSAEHRQHSAEQGVLGKAPARASGRQRQQLRQHLPLWWHWCSGKDTGLLSAAVAHPGHPACQTSPPQGPAFRPVRSWCDWLTVYRM